MSEPAIPEPAIPERAIPRSAVPPAGNTGSTPDLSTVGYGGPWPALLDSIDPDGVHGRVVRADRGAATVLTAAGHVRVTWTPATAPPVTGDWVVVRPDPYAGPDHGLLGGVATRTTSMTRPNTHGQRSSNEADQVLAANVDIVGVVVVADEEPNVRRLERGVVMAYESGAQPLVLLTKVDLVERRDIAISRAEQAAIGVEVMPISPLTGEGVEELRARLAPDRTIVLLGASGVGKSTLTNALVGEEVLVTQDVRAVDGKGRHTTTHRELVALPGGGAVLDTPGLRTLGLGVVEDGMAAAFPEIEELAGGCRFGDCRHDGEPGCAVLAALDDGTLDPDRLEGWRRIRAASENAALRADTAAYRQTARSWGRIYRDAQSLKRR